MSLAAPAPSPDELAQLARARELAARGRGLVSPNPLVGAVVVRDGRVVGEGWHAGPGELHAEAVALRAAGEAARDGTVVCTLEPCSHHGRTPPCTDAIVAAGVRRVVVGHRDPLERDRAGGADVLRRAGIEVVVVDGPAAAACREQNSAFVIAAATGRPEVILKLATSLDGRIATASGESRWISGPEARAMVHRMRADVDAVAVGIGTALADDPALTARDVEGPVRPPARVVFDSDLRLPPEAAMLRDGGPPVLVITSVDPPPAPRAALEAAGAEVQALPGDPAARLAGALDALAAREVQSVLVEGGAGLAAGLVDADLVDRVVWVLAPILIGGCAAPGALGDPGLARLADAPRLANPAHERIGDDLVVSGRLRPLPGGGG